MGYGTKDGYAAPTAREQLALDLFNIAHHGGNAVATWDSLSTEDMLKVNQIYARINENEALTRVLTTPDYMKIAESLSDAQWNALLDLSEATTRDGVWSPPLQYGPSLATIKVLERKGLVESVNPGGVFGTWKTTDLGENVSNAL